MIKIRKRYEVIYFEYDKHGSIIKEKLLKKTNYLFIAKFFFKYRVTVFRDFIKNYYVEVIIYDYKKHCCVAKCEYFINL